jgi:hypothetical protein
MRASVVSSLLFDPCKRINLEGLELPVGELSNRASEDITTPLFTEKRGVLIKPTAVNVYFNHMGVPILKDVRMP